MSTLKGSRNSLTHNKIAKIESIAAMAGTLTYILADALLLQTHKFNVLKYDTREQQVYCSSSGSIMIRLI
jgi:hypothetical protein